MKKILLYTGLAFVAIKTNAQFTAGQKLINGSFSINADNNTNKLTNENRKNFGLSVNPSFGKFTTNTTIKNWGFVVGFNNSSIENSVLEGKSNSFRVGLQYGYTKLYPIVNNFFFTMGVGINATIGAGKTDYNLVSINNTSKFLNTGIGISPGFMFPLNKKILLQTGFSNLASLQFNAENRTEKSATGVVVSEVNINKIEFSGGTTAYSSSGIFIGFSLLL